MSKKRQKAHLWGVHAVKEAVANPNRTIQTLYCSDNALQRNESWINTLPKNQIEVLARKDIDRLVPEGAVHQGLALACNPLEEEFLEDVLNKHQNGMIVILDQVTDPHNIGAIMRSACAFGAVAIVVQTRHAPDPDGVLAKTASGALEHVSYIRETNLSRAIEVLQSRFYTVLGLDERGENVASIRQSDAVALVMGAEGRGLRQKVGEHCDALIKLPTHGPIPTLNVSNAAAVALYAVTQKGAES